MRRISVLCLTAVAAVLLLCVSCGKRAKVIPRGKMAEIYAEMFIMDQWISSDIKSRRMADTTLVYESIFEKYGYTADDYRHSMSVYIDDPDRYARILRNSSVIIEDKIKELKKKKEHLRSLSEIKAATEAFIPERIYFLSGMANRDLLTVDSLSFYIDSTGGEFMFDVQKGYDTLYVGPVMDIVSADSLSMTDTLSVPDILPVKDTAAVKDGLGKTFPASPIVKMEKPVENMRNSKLEIKNR